MADKVTIKEFTKDTVKRALEKFLDPKLKAYLSENYYDKATIDALQTTVNGLLRTEIVTTLPTSDQQANTIYLLKNTEGASGNEYQEYVWIVPAEGSSEEPHWELLGAVASEVDLSGYYTSTQTDAAITAAITAAKADYYDKDAVDGLLDDKADKATTLAGYSIGDAYTKTEVDELLLIEPFTDAEINEIAGNTTTSGD